MLNILEGARLAAGGLVLVMQSRTAVKFKLLILKVSRGRRPACYGSHAVHAMNAADESAVVDEHTNCQETSAFVASIDYRLKCSNRGRRQ